MTPVRSSILDFMTARRSTLDPDDVLGSCDLAFSHHLMGLDAFEDDADFERHLSLLGRRPLAGTVVEPGAGKPLLVHLTAYALASLRLGGPACRPAAQAFVGAQAWDWTRLIDQDRLIPKWPRRYGQHSWRVSHWVGGSVSILAQLRDFAPERIADLAMPSVDAVLVASDSILDARSGLLKTYQSDALHALFNTLYRLRHDPEAGEIGGVVHLHWLNHVFGRPYKAADALFDQGWKLMQRQPFIEAQPYCLDFDIVQLVRTAAGPGQLKGSAVQARARELSDAVGEFFVSQLATDYSLHKLPGAIATMHECALILGEDRVTALDTRSIDIIKDAWWI